MIGSNLKEGAMPIYTEPSITGGGRVVRPLTASGGPELPPDEWFEDPKLDSVTPLTVTADGRVYGHIAPWKQDHIGMSGRRVKPPRSRSGYAYFKTGVVAAASGKDIAVGQLTLAGGHAPLSASAEDAIRHYDDTASAVADVNVGEDRHGIWVAGAVRPGVTPREIRALRASAPSGDWRPLDGSLELVACCQVNVPGFPVARVLTAAGSNEVLAMVAAGAQQMAVERVRNADTSVSRRIAKTETMVAALRTQVAGMRRELRRGELRKRVQRA